MRKLSEIRIDGGTQPRTSINEAAVAEYAEALQAGANFPAMVVFYDGVEYWLADGFHRWHAYKAAGIEPATLDIRTGSRRDAILYSVGANDAHGLRRSNDDKRKAVLTLLQDAEWAKWSDNRIAATCGVSHPFVASVRGSLETVSSEKPAAERSYTTKHGTPAVMNTAKIGKATPPKAPAAAPSKPASDAEPADYFGPSEEEINEALELDAADNAKLHEILASDDPLGEAAREIKRLKSELAVVKQARDGYMNQLAEVVSRFKALKRKLEKLQK